MRLFTKVGVGAASAAMALAVPFGAAAHADTGNNRSVHSINTGILGVAVNGGNNSAILGFACGRGAVNTAILGSAVTSSCHHR